MIVYTKQKTSITLESTPIATAGAEGAVYRVISPSSYKNFCVKIYHPNKRTLIKRRKIEFMINNKPSILKSSNFIICWPDEIVFSSSSVFMGFMMPLAFSSSEKLYELTTPNISKKLQSTWSKFNRSSKSGMEKRLKICVNISICIHSIHKSGNYVIVDYKPQNILVNTTGNISITDVDSFQISSNDMLLFNSEVATPEYAPPESSFINPSQNVIKESWDRFSIAVSFYEILFGIHPFAASCNNGQYKNLNTLFEKISKGLFVHGSKKYELTVIPKLHENFNSLPISLKTLFLKAFEEGQNDPNKRPTAEKWGQHIYNVITQGVINANLVNIPEKNKVKKGYVPPPSPPPPPPPPPKKSFIEKNIGCFIYLIILILIIIYNSSRH
jgi:DNA-binding helix-hairpin-helix protein with protein kinase domain